jgi:primosomal protein N' (replication factor Y)
MRLLVMAPAELDLARTLQPWLAAAPPRGNLRLQVDVDPYSFL